MLKTLACLVGAMTGTASLLAWMDPSDQAPPRLVDSAALQRLVGRLVLDGVTVTPEAWTAVHVLSDLDWATSSGLLVARSSEPSWHFYIDAQGRPSRSRYWERQAGFEEAPTAVRIQIAGSAPGAPMSAAQAQCVQAIVRALTLEFTSTYGEAPHVRVDENWAQVYGVEPGMTVPAASHAPSS